MTIFLFLVLNALALTLLHREKLAPWQASRPAGRDYVMLALFQAGCLLAGPPGLLLSLLLLWALWLDALLFRVFSIELGARGFADIVVSILYRELSEMAFVRRFLRTHLPFALLPVALVLIHLVPLLPERLALWPAVTVAVLGIGFASVSLPGRRSSVLLPFLFGRRSQRRCTFQPRPEHTGLFPHRPTVPRPSTWYGRLRGSDILLFTVESMAADHGATMPVLARLAAGGHGVVSRTHFCVAPLTNEAHLALYGSGYTAVPGFPALTALRSAGYRTVYLSAFDTRLYDLARLLAAAGFDEIRDRLKDDYALLQADFGGSAQPLFLHAHTTHTHLPYRVVDTGRFGRFDSRDDRGRYRNGLEEADFILGSFVERFARERGREPLLLVTADHGQSFGELGYRSHGSAITAQQLNVPFVMHHSTLAPATVPYSSHFDVMPTVLDLLGLPHEPPAFGESIFHAPCAEALRLLVRAAPPSRGETSNAGLLIGRRKYMVDSVLARAWEMSWNDEEAAELEGADKRYYTEMVFQLLAEVGVR